MRNWVLVFLVALAVVLKAAANPSPVGTIMQADVNASGHNITNAADISATEYFLNGVGLTVWPSGTFVPDGSSLTNGGGASGVNYGLGLTIQGGKLVATNSGSAIFFNPTWFNTNGSSQIDFISASLATVAQVNLSGTTTSNAYAALDTVVSNGLVTWENATFETIAAAVLAGATTSNAFAALDTVVSNGLVMWENATFETITAAAAAYQPLSAALTTLAGNNGASLTGLNGSAVASGTIPQARLGNNAGAAGAGWLFVTDGTGNSFWTNQFNLWIPNLYVGTNGFITNNFYVDGNIYGNSIILTNGETNLSLTASEPIVTDANDKLVSQTYATFAGNLTATLNSFYQPLASALTTLAGNNGANLTGLNASDLASGTVADARLTAAPAVSGANLTSGTIPLTSFSVAGASTGQQITLIGGVWAPAANNTFTTNSAIWFSTYSPGSNLLINLAPYTNAANMVFRVAVTDYCQISFTNAPDGLSFVVQAFNGAALTNGVYFNYALASTNPFPVRTNYTVVSNTIPTTSTNSSIDSVFLVRGTNVNLEAQSIFNF